MTSRVVNIHDWTKTTSNYPPAPYFLKVHIKKSNIAIKKKTEENYYSAAYTATPSPHKYSWKLWNIYSRMEYRITKNYETSEGGDAKRTKCYKTFAIEHF